MKRRQRQRSRTIVPVRKDLLLCEVSHRSRNRSSSYAQARTQTRRCSDHYHRSLDVLLLSFLLLNTRHHNPHAAINETTETTTACGWPRFFLCRRLRSRTDEEKTVYAAAPVVFVFLSFSPPSRCLFSIFRTNAFAHRSATHRRRSVCMLHVIRWSILCAQVCLRSKEE